MQVIDFQDCTRPNFGALLFTALPVLEVEHHPLAHVAEPVFLLCAVACLNA
jgi:hypothetical protein